MLATKATSRTPYPQPVRLSKAGMWLKEHKGGIISYVDYKAVEK